MTSRAYITTSWDDGHILDFRVAEMLAKHGLRGTFYIPREASTGVMAERQVRELSASFEIGAHTMRHVFLDTVDDQVAGPEIRDSKRWVEDLTGNPCPLFCPPGGKFKAVHLDQIEAAGFDALRSVELLSLVVPRSCGKLLVMPTTVQTHAHPAAAYVRNALKRRSLQNLWNYVLHGRSTDWGTVAEAMLDVARHRGGVFHLWGHSWEIEEHGQWSRLDEVLKLLGSVSRQVWCVSNGELCEEFRVRSTASSRAAA